MIKGLMFMKRTSLIVCVLISPLFMAQASAGIAEVKVCQQKLPQQAQLILTTLMPRLSPDADAAKLMKSTVIELVRSDKIDRASARENAMAAADCLRLMQSG